MLLGQNFRGGHHCCLVAGRKGHEHGQHGHNGFPGTHIPLNQAIHGATTGEVPVNIAQHTALGAGEFKGEFFHYFP